MPRRVDEDTCDDKEIRVPGKRKGGLHGTPREDPPQGRGREITDKLGGRKMGLGRMKTNLSMGRTGVAKRALNGVGTGRPMNQVVWRP